MSTVSAVDKAFNMPTNEIYKGFKVITSYNGKSAPYTYILLTDKFPYVYLTRYGKLVEHSEDGVQGFMFDNEDVAKRAIDIIIDKEPERFI